MNNTLYTPILLALTFILIGSTTIQAQKLKLTDGKFEELKDQKSLLVEFDYSDMAVGKYKDEQKYIDKKVEDKNEKEAGTGDAWAEAWVDDRENRFEPKFFELFTKHLEDTDLEASADATDAPYTLIVHTTFTEIGFNVGIMRKPAYINVMFKLKDNASGKIVSAGKMEKIKGQDAMGFDFDTGFRLAEGYANAGKRFAKHLTKKVL